MLEIHFFSIYVGVDMSQVLIVLALIKANIFIVIQTLIKHIYEILFDGTNSYTLLSYIL